MGKILCTLNSREATLFNSMLETWEPSYDLDRNEANALNRVSAKLGEAAAENPAEPTIALTAKEAESFQSVLVSWHPRNGRRYSQSIDRLCRSMLRKISSSL